MLHPLCNQASTILADCRSFVATLVQQYLLYYLSIMFVRTWFVVLHCSQSASFEVLDSLEFLYASRTSISLLVWLCSGASDTCYRHGFDKRLLNLRKWALLVGMLISLDQFPNWDGFMVRACLRTHYILLYINKVCFVVLIISWRPIWVYEHAGGVLTSFAPRSSLSLLLLNKNAFNHFKVLYFL